MLKALLNLFIGSSSGKSAESKKDFNDLENFVDYVVKSLVDYPAEVRVSIKDKNGEKSIFIDCNSDDVGKIVGKHGKTIMAIRSLVTGAAGRLGQKVAVEVRD